MSFPREISASPSASFRAPCEPSRAIFAGKSNMRVSREIEDLSAIGANHSTRIFAFFLYKPQRRTRIGVELSLRSFATLRLRVKCLSREQLLHAKAPGSQRIRNGGHSRR